MTANNDKQLTRRAVLRGMLATPAVLMSPTMSKQAASALHNLAATAQAPLVAAQTAAAQPGSKCGRLRTADPEIRLRRQG